ncbi:MAG: magnesium transporter [Spirochaetales bacterium]|nr:magnesium transporter [Spirochaetales bacterium]
MDWKDNIEWETLDSGELKALLADIPLADLLEDWDSFSDEEAIRIFIHLDPETKVDVINELSNTKQETLLTLLSERHLKQLMAEMEPDDVTDFLQEMSPEIRKSVWDNLSDELRTETLFLLRFDEDDAAGLMTPRYLAIRGNVSVHQALQFVRRNAEKVEAFYSVYVVDELQRLLGVISLQELLGAGDDTIVKDIMDTQFASVREDTDQEEAAQILETYDLTSLPVVNSHNKLLGVITFDDIIDVIREEHTEDTYKMGAMTGNAGRYLDTSIMGMVKKRVPWLVILLLLGTVTTTVLDHYQASFLGMSFLILFIPVITQTGGNSGNQASTLMIRGLATGELHTRDTGKVLIKEIAIGLIMGIVTGLVIVLRSWLMPPGVSLFEALVIGMSLSFVVIFATVIGALAPMVISKMGFDPTVMSGPLMSTVIDVCGLTIYFETARRLLNLG